MYLSSFHVNHKIMTYIESNNSLAANGCFNIVITLVIIVHLTFTLSLDYKLPEGSLSVLMTMYSMMLGT